MDLKQLQEIGGIVSEKPIDKKVKWRRLDSEGKYVDSEFVVQVLVLPYGQIEEIMLSAGAGRSARFVSAAIRLNKGKESLTVEQAGSLNPVLFKEFIRVFNEVNGTGEEESGN